MTTYLPSPKRSCLILCLYSFLSCGFLLLRHLFFVPTTYNDSFINTVFTKDLSQYLVTLVGLISLTSEDFGTHFLCELQC